MKKKKLILSEAKTNLMLKFSLQTFSQSFESSFFNILRKVADIW